MLKHYTIISFDEKPSENTSIKTELKKCEISANCSTIDALIKSAQNEKICEQSENTQISNLLKSAKTITEKIKGKLDLCCTKSILSENIDAIQNHLKNQNIVLAEPAVFEGKNMACGLQSICINWANSSFIEYKGYKYCRIKEQTFMISEANDFIIIVIKTSDQTIGGIIAIPKTKKIEELPEISELWVELKKIMMGGSGKPMNYKEVWVPGFNIKCDNSGCENSVKITDNKYARNIKESGTLQLYNYLPNEGSLIVDNMENKMIIEKEFIFGILRQK